MKAYDVRKLVAELKSNNVRYCTSYRNNIYFILCCMFWSPDPDVLFIVLPHTYSKPIGHKQVPPLHERKKFLKSLKFVRGHWKWYHLTDCIVYEFLFIFRCNYGRILYHFWTKARNWSKNTMLGSWLVCQCIFVDSLFCHVWKSKMIFNIFLNFSICIVSAFVTVFGFILQIFILIYFNEDWQITYERSRCLHVESVQRQFMFALNECHSSFEADFQPSHGRLTHDRRDIVAGLMRSLESVRMSFCLSVCLSYSVERSNHRTPSWSLLLGQIMSSERRLLR